MRWNVMVRSLKFAICSSLLAGSLVAPQMGLSKVFSLTIKATTPGPQQLLLSGGVNLEANLPKGYKLAVLPLGDRLTYMFMGPDDKNGEHAVLTVDVLPETTKLSSSKSVFDQVFRAYSTGSSDFKTTPAKPITVNGVQLEKAGFGGSMEGGRSSGFAVVTRIKRGFFVMVARDKENDFKKSEAIMMSIVNSCKFKNQ